MFQKSIAVMLLCAGCATIFNKKEIDITMDPGVSVDGATGSTTINQREDHQVSYANGGTCKIDHGVSVAYVIVDLFLTGPIGLIIDGVTGNWTVSKSDCDGVYKK